MVSKSDDTNAGVSILRVVSDALVQEPENWRAILARAKTHASSLHPNNVGVLALHALEKAFESNPTLSNATAVEKIRQEIHQLAREWMSMEELHLGKPMTPTALAGESLLMSLRG